MKKIGFPFIVCCLLWSFTLHSCGTTRNCNENEHSNNNDSLPVVYKPNIYVYPQQTIDLSVKLNFPKGGSVLTSIPEYNTVWNVQVTPSGQINETYSYLFYESQQPDVWQTHYGWVVEKDNLPTFFRENMSNYGFNDSEITDFINYWIPRLKQHQFYVIYPQTKELISKVIQLDFSLKPDNLLRLFYVIKGKENKLQDITTPTINKFQREGYVATEWGVILE